MLMRLLSNWGEKNLTLFASTIPGEMRGEEKPYEMTAGNDSSEVDPMDGTTMTTMTTAASAPVVKQKIQLQHLQPPPQQPPPQPQQQQQQVQVVGEQTKQQLQQQRTQAQRQQQQQQQNLAIQQRLQHLSPVNPKSLVGAVNTNTSVNKLVTSVTSVTAPPSILLPLTPVARSEIGKATASQPPNVIVPTPLGPAPSPSTASTISSLSSGPSLSPPLAATSILHPLDSLLTPAASPEDDSLEPWIQTV